MAAICKQTTPEFRERDRKKEGSSTAEAPMANVAAVSLCSTLVHSRSRLPLPLSSSPSLSFVCPPLLLFACGREAAPRRPLPVRLPLSHPRASDHSTTHTGEEKGEERKGRVRRWQLGATVSIARWDLSVRVSCPSSDARATLGSLLPFLASVLCSLFNHGCPCEEAPASATSTSAHAYVCTPGCSEGTSTDCLN